MGGDAALALLDEVLVQLPGNAPRTGQREMVAAVDRALAEKKHLLVQAGTGTGKSLGYLVPVLANVLPECDVVIVDEAHELDRFVTEALTRELSATAVARAVRMAAKSVRRETEERLSQALHDAEALLRELRTAQ
jgi:ATP-dependent DNA helicase DinG